VASSAACFADPKQGNRYAYATDNPISNVDPAGQNALSDFFTTNCTVLEIEQGLVAPASTWWTPTCSS
jgi:hypothetical protein